MDWFLYDNGRLHERVKSEKNIQIWSFMSQFCTDLLRHGLDITSVIGKFSMLIYVL